MPTLPASAPAEFKEEVKLLSTLLEDVVKGQIHRLEVLMVCQYAWPASVWLERYTLHPLLRPFAVRLVWGAYDQSGSLIKTFRALEEGSLTGRDDEAIVLPLDTTVRMLHPLVVDDEEREAWIRSLEDYEIKPPFPQMNRPVMYVSADQKEEKMYGQFNGTDMTSLTFKGRAERLGWRRGSICDSGSIDAYWKSFPAAGVDAFLGVDGMAVGADFDARISLKDACFVTTGSVQVGSYIYDTPTSASDSRLIPFGSVPAVVFSEVVSDMRKIVGVIEAAVEVD